MDIKLQTKVTDNNRVKFYQTNYQQQFDTKQQLIDLEKFSNECVLIDCCGWHYRNNFPNSKIICLETVKSALQFKLDKSKFDRLVDDQQDFAFGWPSLQVADPVLVFDRSAMLKYRSIDDLVSILSNAVETYHANRLLLNLNTLFVNDNRLSDRFYNLTTISIPGFVVEEFVYAASSTKLFIHFRRKHVV